jgi:hypothetical protein
MENFTVGDLRIEAAAPAPPAPLTLTWRGKSNDRSPARTLAPYFASALASATERGTALELHFEKIDHFNSSTITAVIQLIQDARRAAVDLVLVYDAALKWQKLSFDALRVFLRDGHLELRAI